MDDIDKLNLVLPEFQREYVWSREQAKQLMVSLFRGYPTGSLLFWKTDNPPAIKNAAVRQDGLGTTQVILDGQQRLTTLYLLSRDEVPPYYTEQDLQTDPRNLYFDLDTGDFQYHQVSVMSNNPTWRSVIECFDSGQDAINIFEIAQGKSEDSAEQLALSKKYNENLTRLRNILERDYPIQVVPPGAGIDDAIDVFDRVNSLGTKLSDAELALAHITAKWPEARQVMKDKMAQLSKRRFHFDLTFMVRSLTGVALGRSLFETVHKTPADVLVPAWKELDKILDYLVGLLPGQAHVHSTEDLNTNNVLVPATVYLAENEGRFSSDKELRQFVHWMYAANVWRRYTSQTDQRLDHDVAVITQHDNPWPDLVDAIIEQRGRIEVKASDLEGRIIQHPLYRTAFILAKSRGAIDWFNGTPLSAPTGKYSIHSHHIFPQSLLYNEGGYNSENHLHKKIVNEIANRAFLTGDSNISLGNTPPADYLPEIQKKYPGALEKQFVPTDPNLWELDRYEDFLHRRRELIANAINEHLDQLLQELEPASVQTLDDLLSAGESPLVEYKSTLRWDLHRKQVNKDLQKVIAKTVAGLLNFEGGTLLIGVADDGTVLGLDDDLKTLSSQSFDAFYQTLVNVLENYLGVEFAQFVHVEFEDHPEGTVCRIDVEPAPMPVFLGGGDTKEFYVRAGNTTRQLDAAAAHDYIGMHWDT